ncbi:hypothetical protein [Microbispora siamensis]|uniref:Uncharacterized protein n=1 Tax=Microbispora siamensis TaxID=564413 RepID=A0ABQ4GNK2_9ACTN|nr:hypothetical protein [Microbispora siamensis]GIH63002.1 hypothetical protein Msi02_38190 [Microbispora siamensis]
MRRTSKKTLLRTALAVTAAAPVGGLSTDRHNPIARHNPEA